ncbi:hypothetical protein ABZS83_36695 [Streptomyces sp. NPDC005426]|uniref:hypothetical protein n=1 Tax=Streptomyces sp. NPDC005426 TaxID=3155344 RepID=UPI0033AFC2DE
MADGAQGPADGTQGWRDRLDPVVSCEGSPFSGDLRDGPDAVYCHRLARQGTALPATGQSAPPY